MAEKTSKILLELWTKYRAYVIGYLVLVAFVLFFGILVLPPLLFPIPEITPSYDVFDLGGASTTLEPSEDHLVVLDEQGVAAFVPRGAFPDGGRLILKERRDDLVPDRVSEGSIRLQAVDVTFLDRSGQSISPLVLGQPILLCFDLSKSQQAQMQEGTAYFEIQYFNEFVVKHSWEALMTTKGWQDNQLCANITHLSLFALSMRVATPKSGDGLTPSPNSPTEEIPQLYELPQ